MVERVLRALQAPIRGLHEAAYLLAAFAFLSQVLALLRDRAFTHSFGAGPILDVYFASFRIPDLIFATVASLVSAYVLIPFLAERQIISKESVTAFLSEVVSFFAVLGGVVALVAFIVMPTLLTLAVPGIATSPFQDELLWLSRLLLIQPILLGFSGILGAVTQLSHRFVLYSLSPLLYNAGIIFGVFFFYPIWGIQGLGAGVVLGALLHLLIQIPVLFAEGYSVRWRLPSLEFFHVIRIAVPRALALASTQITLLFLVGFASFFAVGSIAVFSLALNVQSVPLSIIAISYSVAAFPTLAGFIARKEHEQFLLHMSAAVRHILFWSIPAIVMFIVLRAQIVRVIFGSGAFSWDDTRLTAAALALFVVSLVAQGLNVLFIRAYYAAGKTALPSIIAALGTVLTVILAFVFSYVFGQSLFVQRAVEALLRVEGISGTHVLVLPLAYSVGVFSMLAAYAYFFRRDFGGLAPGLNRVVFQVFCTSVIGGFAAYLTLAFVLPFVDTDTFLGIFLQGLSAGIVGLAVTTYLLYLVKNTELLEAISSLSRRLLRPKDVPPGQDLEETLT
jgi:putative peptidoglycan lipid II flippase